MSRKILLISRDFYLVEQVKKILSDDDVFGCYRDYHVEKLIAEIRPDFILSDGTCKTRLGDDSESVPISFDPGNLAKKYGVPVRSLQIFLLIRSVKRFFTSA
jgi:hypothetical protein